MEAFFEFFDAGGLDKYGGDAAFEKRVGLGGLAEGGGTLDVDVEEEVDAGGEFVLDFAFEGAVEVGVDFGVLVEFAGGDFGFEGGAVEKVVVDFVLFLVARGACGGGDDACDVIDFGEHAVAEGGFTAACWAGYDEEDAGLIGGVVRCHWRDLIGAGDCDQDEAVNGEEAAEGAGSFFRFVEPGEEVAQFVGAGSEYEGDDNGGVNETDEEEAGGRILHVGGHE